jgi:predicted kinase
MQGSKQPLGGSAITNSPGAVMGDVWIVNGMPGVGKSTVARKLAERWPRGAHLEADRLQELIVSGSVPPGSLPLEEQQRQVRLNIRNQCLLARSFLQEDFTAVIDYVLPSRERLEEYRAQLPDAGLHLVTLDPGLDAAVERDRARPEKTVAADWMHLHAEIRAALAGVGLWVDSARLTPDETVARILAGRELARL